MHVHACSLKPPGKKGRWNEWKMKNYWYISCTIFQVTISVLYSVCCDEYEGVGTHTNPKWWLVTVPLVCRLGSISICNWSLALSLTTRLIMPVKNTTREDELVHHAIIIFLPSVLTMLMFTIVLSSLSGSFHSDDSSPAGNLNTYFYDNSLLSWPFTTELLLADLDSISSGNYSIAFDRMTFQFSYNRSQWIDIISKHPLHTHTHCWIWP